MPAYTGPERRRKGLVECDTCHRRLREGAFDATRDYDRLAVSGLEPSCIDCVTHRQLRGHEFNAIRDYDRLAVSGLGLEASCINCAAERDEQRRAAEIRAMYPAPAAPPPVERVVERVIQRHAGQVEHVRKVFKTRDVGGKTILEGSEEEKWWTDEVPVSSDDRGVGGRKRPTPPVGRSRGGKR